MAEIGLFFQFYLFFGFYSSKKYTDFGNKSGIRLITSKKNTQISVVSWEK